MSDILKFDTTTTPITRYEDDDGTWTIDNLHSNEVLALNGSSIVLSKTFADRIKTVTYTPLAGSDSLYSQTSEVFTKLDGTLLSSPTAIVSNGENDNENETDNHGSGDGQYQGSASDDFQDGGLGDDHLDGGNGNDELWGGEGNDSVIGGIGADMLRGDTGNDDLDGGEGDDDLNGGEGTDLLNGGNGDDLLTGGNGADTLNGGVGNDYLYAGSGDDTVDGGDGDDTIVGGDGAGNDSYTGGLGLDTIKYASAKAAITISLTAGTAKSTIKSKDAGIGIDTLFSIENITAGSYNDTLIGNSNQNVLSGEKGNDLLKGGDGNDTLDGGDGIDTADYSDKFNSVVAAIDGSNSTNVTVNGSIEDSIKNFENIIGGSGDDTLSGDGNSNSLSGGSGNDLLKGGSGNDTLDGGAGTDTVDYSDKSTGVMVTLNGSTTVDVKVQGVKEDKIKNFENVTGGSSNDALTGDSLANVLIGGDGSDNLKGVAGNDTLDGGSGNDTLIGGLSDDSLTGGAGNDRFVFDVKLNAKISNVDIITDFTHTEDQIVLNKSLFKFPKDMISNGVLTQTAFDLGYLKTTSNKDVVSLYFDADGTIGGKAEIKFAEVTIIGASNLDVSDFIIA